MVETFSNVIDNGCGVNELVHAFVVQCDTSAHVCGQHDNDLHFVAHDLQRLARGQHTGDALGLAA